MTGLDLGAFNEIVQRYVDQMPTMDRADLERRVEAEPDDVEGRIHLALLLTAIGDRDALFPHLKWLVMYEPLFGSASSPFKPPDPRYVVLRDLRLETVRAHPENEVVLQRAVAFLEEHDTPEAISIVVAAAERKPSSVTLARTAGALIFYAASRQIAEVASYKDALAYYRRVVTIHDAMLQRFPQGPTFKGMPALVAFEAGEFRVARQWASDAVAAENFGASDERHLGHTVLGRLALRESDVESAKAHLGQSAAEALTTDEDDGELKENHLGPSLRLARDLLDHGCRDEVVAYLRRVAPLWNQGQRCLDWADALERGDDVDLVNHRR